jgi:hypothetical protein
MDQQIEKLTGAAAEVVAMWSLIPCQHRVCAERSKIVLALPLLRIVKRTCIGAGEGRELCIGDCNILLFGTSLCK